MATFDVDSYRSTFMQDALIAHNKYRAQHSAPALVLDDELNSHAQDWAEKCAKNAKLSYCTAGGKHYGQNLHQAFNSSGIKNITGENVSNAFYHQSSRYDYNNGGSSSETGNFTQLVWKKSLRLGIGVAVNPNNKNQVFSVFNYDPPGNMAGAYRDNVLPKN